MKAILTMLRKAMIYSGLVLVICLTLSEAHYYRRWNNRDNRGGASNSNELLNLCAAFNCTNGGTCVVVPPRTPICICPVLWTGLHCEISRLAATPVPAAG